jgi:hypothetical protein
MIPLLFLLIVFGFFAAPFFQKLWESEPMIDGVKTPWFLKWQVVLVAMSGVVLLAKMADLAKEEPKPRDSSGSAAYSEPVVEAASSREASSVVWTSKSNGYTWKFASKDEKMDLCHRLASASPKGNSASFYFDNLNAFFATTDPKILETSLDDITRLIEGASAGISSKRQRF